MSTKRFVVTWGYQEDGVFAKRENAPLSCTYGVQTLLRQRGVRGAGSIAG